MYFIIKIHIMALSVFLLSSCASKPTEASVAYGDFPQTIALKGTTVPVDTALFRYPFRIRVQGDKVAVMDLHSTDHFCHLFHYPDFRYLASLGKRGKLPVRCFHRKISDGMGNFCGCSIPVNRKLIGMGCRCPATRFLVRKR